MAAKTLITGGAGFIGSHLAERLKEQGQTLILIDDLSTGRRQNVDHLLDDRCVLVEARAGDALRDDPSLLDGVQHVYHLASSVGVRLVARDPAAVICNIIHQTNAILQAAADRCTAVLVASSSEVYGCSARIPLVEIDELVYSTTSSSRWCYGMSKAVTEHLALSYHQRHRAGAIVVRFFNTIGPRQVGRYGMVVPRFVQQAVASEPLQIYGNGQQTRAFCDVRDVVWAMVALMNAPEHHGKVFNVGSDQVITIDQLADRIITLANCSSEKHYVPFEQAYKPGFEDLAKRVPDLSRLRRAIGYEPQYSLDRTLEELIRLAQATDARPVAGERG